MTKRQVRIWNRRRAEILRAIAEFKREEEMQPIAAAFESMVNQVDALVTQGFIDFNDP